MQTVNELDYAYRKLVVKAREKRNNTIDISDEDYNKYYSSEYKPEPLPDSDIPIPGEEDPDHDYSQDYLTFEALENGTFSFTINDLYYSTNNGYSWKALAAGTETELITKGTKVLWKGDSNMKNKGSQGGSGTFSSTCKFNISGNVLSLLFNGFNNNIVFGQGNYCYSNTNNEDNNNNYRLFRLFYHCENLISAENFILPNKTLYGYINGYNYCAYIYSGMFEGCTNLILPPKILPATTLSIGCYYGMFKYCSSLIKASILPANKLIDRCYEDMFIGCTSLKYIKCLAEDFRASNCLQNWVQDASNEGTFIRNAASSFNDIGPSGIPAGWEVIDEEVPEE